MMPPVSRRVVERPREVHASLGSFCDKKSLPCLAFPAGYVTGRAHRSFPGLPPLYGEVKLALRDCPAVERLVTALHEGAGARGRLPGRAIVCARANLSEVRFARLMGLLVTRGCIVGRSARKPGRLVYATPEETLAHLRSSQ